MRPTLLLLTAQVFIDALQRHSSAAEREKIQRYSKSGVGDYGEGDHFIGVRLGQVFALAEQSEAMPLDQIEELLESPIHEARAGAVKIMAKQSAGKATTEIRRRELFDLYLRRLGAPYCGLGHPALSAAREG